MKKANKLPFTQAKRLAALFKNKKLIATKKLQNKTYSSVV